MIHIMLNIPLQPVASAPHSVSEPAILVAPIYLLAREQQPIYRKGFVADRVVISTYERSPTFSD